MIIIKPREVNGIAKLLADLTRVNIFAILNDSSEERVALSLPKFKFEFNVNLNNMLKSMGIHDLFQSANLNSMTDYGPELYVSDIIQKGFIAIDEEGTTAAAAQSFNLKVKKAIQAFDVNHPFVFYVKDNKRVYFAGKVWNP